jgi:ATP-dependent RNA helicase DDX31/DBP7
MTTSTVSAGRVIMFLLPGPAECYVDAVLKEVGNPIHADMDEVFGNGFGRERVNKNLEWEDKASEWQLEVERWVLADKVMMDLANKV